MELNNFSGFCATDRAEVTSTDIGRGDFSVSYAFPPRIKEEVKYKCLEDETGEFLIMTYGKYLALGFRGDSPFVTRCENWTENMGLTNSHSGGKIEFHRRDFETYSLGYVLVKNKDIILEALRRQIGMEIIANKEVAPIFEGWEESEESEIAEYVIQYDEAKIDEIAATRAERFLNEKIKSECFMVHYDGTADDSMYSVSSFNRGGKWESVKVTDRSFGEAKGVKGSVLAVDEIKA